LRTSGNELSIIANINEHTGTIKELETHVIVVRQESALTPPKISINLLRISSVVVPLRSLTIKTKFYRLYINILLMQLRIRILPLKSRVHLPNSSTPSRERNRAPNPSQIRSNNVVLPFTKKCFIRASTL
jgi:hypothetical protein